MPKPTKPNQSQSGAPLAQARSGQPGVRPSDGAEPKPTKATRAGKEDRAEELRFKVTTAFKQNFKQVAKDLGIKKVALLETLLADWQSRRAANGPTARPVAAKAAPAPVPARPSSAKKRRSRLA